MEPESNERGEWFDAEAIACHVNEEHGETMRDLADYDEGREEAFVQAHRQMQEVNAEVTPESARQAIREIDELRKLEGYIEQDSPFD